jgi:Flp pilus assembly protein TadG
MRLTKPTVRRSGAAVVEAAVVIPIVLLLLYGILCGAYMVLVVDEVDTATREAARFASVRGSSYAFNTGQPAASASDISTFVKAQGVTMDPSLITCNVSWAGSNRPGNYVTVEVHYQWPGLGPFGAQEFVGRSTMLISY